MFFSERHGILFVHVGRTGGTSVERFLSSLTGEPFSHTYIHPRVIEALDLVKPPFSYWAKNPDSSGKINCKHATAAQLRGILSEQEWKRLYKFSICRDPLDRLISTYGIYTQSSIYNNHPIREYSSFGGFVDAITDGSCQWHDQNRQYHSLYDSSGNLLVDSVIPFSQLEEGVSAIAAKLPCRAMHVPFPQINVTDRSRFSGAYSDAQASAISKLYNLDTVLYEQFTFSLQNAANIATSR